MKHSRVLLVDAAINLALGSLLVTFPPQVVQALGVPMVENAFYPSILGGVLIGIGVALLIEYFRDSGELVGLGLGGAIAINLCGGIVLAIWLLSGGLNLPPRGKFFLWVLVAILVGVSSLEWLVYAAKRQKE